MVYVALTDRRRAGDSGPHAGHVPIASGLLLTVIGLSVGFNCGTALNPARDFGGRFFTLTAGWDFNLVQWVHPRRYSYQSSNILQKKNVKRFHEKTWRISVRKREEFFERKREEIPWKNVKNFREKTWRIFWEKTWRIFWEKTCFVYKTAKRFFRLSKTDFPETFIRTKKFLLYRDIFFRIFNVSNFKFIQSIILSHSLFLCIFIICSWICPFSVEIFHTTFHYTAASHCGGFGRRCYCRIWARWSGCFSINCSSGITCPASRGTPWTTTGTTRQRMARIIWCSTVKSSASRRNGPDTSR